jgi:hypothetical protein
VCRTPEPTGTQTIGVGGQLGIYTTNQAPGVYTGTFDVTVMY